MTALDAQKLKDIVIMQNQIKILEEGIAERKAELALNELPIGTYDEGMIEVVVSRNARFDSEKAQILYPLNDDNMPLYTVKIESAAAKKFMTGAEYEACQKEFPNNKVEIRLKN